jgi:tellurite resistance protein TerC
LQRGQPVLLEVSRVPIPNEWLAWIGFHILIFAMLALDLGVFRHGARVVTIREALGWSAVWIALALVFNVGVAVWHPRHHEAAFEFFTGYVVEKSLSVDNLFVFLVIFSYFRVRPEHQHRLLFWGILGALALRAVFIFGGIALLNHFHWLIYVLGAFLVFTGIKLIFKGDDHPQPDRNPVIRLCRRILPMTSEYRDGKFWVRESGRWLATPLFLVLLVVEMTDVVFALDSIPAILAISRDPFIVYTSNAFAILGLRALYFALAGLIPLLRFLNYGLAAVLVFIGIKMVIAEHYKVPTGVSLAVVGLFLGLSVAASFLPLGKKLPIDPRIFTEKGSGDTLRESSRS